jgi:hypothetical protein
MQPLAHKSTEDSFYLNFMKSRLLICLLSVGIAVSCRNSSSDSGPRVSIITDKNERKADILVDNKLFTSYCWPENVYKPILYPVLNASGTEITRGFPLKPREGEQTDHIHQTGIWLNYGNVNGIDFWGNGYRGVKEPAGGEIRHVRIDRIQSRNGEGLIVAFSNWLAPNGKVLLDEKTEMHFIADGTNRVIDRVTTLTARDTAVLFKDTKEGMFGIRVARQLELPSKTGVILIDSTGNPSAIKDTLNTGVSGNYLSSEGVQGEAVWGTRARWMDLYGVINGENISLVVCDHPKNPGYPTYWHARGYGLFSANPLGRKDFTQGKEEFNFTIPPKKSATFRYRVIISSGAHLTAEQINAYADAFAKKYR